MATIMFGSIQATIQKRNGAMHKLCSYFNNGEPKPYVKAEQVAVQRPSLKSVAHMFRMASQEAMREYEAGVKAMDMALKKDPKIQNNLLRKEFSPIQKGKNGVSRIKLVSLAEANARKRLKELREKEEADFLAGKFEGQATAGQVHGLTEKTVGEQVSFKTPFYRRTPKQSKRTPKQRRALNVVDVTESVLKLASETGLQVQMIMRGRQKPITVHYVRKYDSVIPKVTLTHESGKYVQKEVSYMVHKENFIELCKFARYKPICESSICAGDSGLLFDERSSITTNNTKLPHFIVRGRKDRKLVSALDQHADYFSIQHYSRAPELQFFDGWRRVFDRMQPHTEDHACTVDYTNDQCGEIAAAISQSLFPVKKLSCNKCRQHMFQMSWDEYKQYILAHLRCCKITMQTNEGFSSIKQVTKLMEQATSENNSIEDSLKIVQLTQNYTSTQMLQIQDINRALMKGSSVTQEELRQATKQLLEMTQWWKKHMTLTGEDALKTFRNKRASKALINPSLLCDNQLDRNGNFVWGERGKHSKRFFANFFDEVVPSEGYEKYVLRRNPNGARKLAIGSLVVPLDLERARSVLQGEPVRREPLTTACVSTQDNNFIYPCCCVTQEDGKPLYSELKSPTKRHLVVGTSGDPKYIDLPATDTDRMYIAKEGYCYLNIFLAMLVNVNEDDAKDFTKMVRDVLVPKLGKWPSMMDLATAVHMLTIFHPETRSAELPRILVDHASQTMHVIDSFGSLNVGYHILKAGTINHLVQFASNDLKSELKHYKVGGDAQQRVRCENALISSIFKPKRMQQILLHDPYVLVMGLISPTILVHMYRMRHFDKGIELWISKDRHVAQILILLEQLTKRVALNDVLIDQLKMISQTSERMYDLLKDSPTTYHSYQPAKSLLEEYMNSSLMNKELSSNGYRDCSEELYSHIEKIYGKRLEQEWYALSWLEKCSSTWRLRKFSPATEQHLIKQVADEKRESSRKFVSSCFITAQTYLRSSRDMCYRSCERALQAVIGKIINCSLKFIHKCYSDIIFLVNVSILLSLFIQMASTLRKTIHDIKVDRIGMAMIQTEKDERTLVHMYDLFVKSQKELPTLGEFSEHVQLVRPDLMGVLKSMTCDGEDVITQSKSHTQLKLEKIVAFMALLTMCIDSERSDAVFKILRNIKTVFGTMGEDVRVQSLDEIDNIEDDKKLTIDFDLSTNRESTSVSFDVNFEDWWDRQLQQNRVVPHYRTIGEFLEFTRETAVKVANQIATSDAREFLVRGAVGSGKSTGLPHHLAKKGKVLLLEPTRPLAENVSRQLVKDPFYQTVTLRMRGLSRFGSSNITVMTSGFAFHYFVHNQHQLAEYDYIIIDECHVLDSPAIAFNCALKEYEYAGKLIKVSATPPGRECEFTTQFPVKLKIEEQLSFQSFVQAQGTGSNADMVQHGNNLLVYVASYNEVDQLSKLLLNKGYQVTKVDGRTMQMGNIMIETKGSELKPHFVVATNIIENGVTLDIDCVIDFGLKVVATLDVDSRCVRYDKKAINYGERIQRLGRVGRHKPGFALRIGQTEKGIEEIPEFIATEAAFLSFAHSLPITTQSVSTNLLARCTVKQAKVALNFEITPFFTVHLIKYDGSIHPEIHKLLCPFKIRESAMLLNKTAIPHQYTGQWISVKDYERIGIKVHCDESVRIPFFVNGIPDKLFEALWETVKKYRCDAGFGKITSVNASKISYTLSTDPSALPRTIASIDHLICEEMTKSNHFDTVASANTSFSFSLDGIADKVRKRYLRDYTKQNIAILQQARAQLLEFNTHQVDFNDPSSYENLGVLNTVRLQSKSELCSYLGLKGKWDGKKFMNDIVVAVFTIIGGGWMLWDYFYHSLKEPVSTQGKKRMIQKLKFRDAFDRKVGREVYADDYTMEHTFGEAYTKKGKQKGSTNTRGMGKKSRNFIHMYGVEPENYSTLRFVDPLTGHTMDENPRVDVRLVQEEMGAVRRQLLDDDKLDAEMIRSKPGLQAYFLGRNTEEALKIDLTPHRPTLLCMNSNAIAGFPEREDELRQTGLPQKVPLSEVPKPNEVVGLESASVYKGLRDYNSISTLVCRLKNVSDGHTESIYGIGYGSYIITNGHLFRKNNGTLNIKTWHGDFVINNTTQLKIYVLDGKDAIIIRMPKDFPPFPEPNVFRAPLTEERACLVGTNFQEKSLRATVSESSIVTPEGESSYWTHWITTKEGDCGLPLVSVNDGHIIGFHGLKSNVSTKNFFVPFTNDFKKKYLDNAENLSWNKHWLWQPDKIEWGSLNLISEQPSENFKISKLVTDLFSDTVTVQSKRDRWVLEAAQGNLVACGQAKSSLVTKHVVKGKCHHFEQYLATHPEAAQFFKPLMGKYQPSRLNKEAFKRDFFKYNKPVVLNEVSFDAFEQAVDGVKLMMLEFGFHECVYVTDSQEIYDSLNMKAAVGAQYTGKKQDYFADMDVFDRDRLLYLSCERLFYGYKGVWNGSLKAELRPIEKVQENKTRTFTAAPIDTLLGAKVCVDDFNNQFYSLNLICPWTVGMTKFYGGWDKLMRALPDGWLYCHADGSQFDSSLTPLLLNAVLDIRTFFMEDWWVGREMLENLYAEIVYTPILTPDGTVFKKFRGNNSGQPSTVVDNTLMVVVSMYYACIKQGWNDDDIQNRLVFFANGDDVILAVQDDDAWLLDTLTQSFSELGLNYDFSERTKIREELWFMSHQAMLVDGVYIPKLEPERIVSILEWDRSKELIHRTEAICASMIEAWGYTDLLTEIRKFYLWLLGKDEFKELAAIGKAPYIAEMALRKLYLDVNVSANELQQFLKHLHFDIEGDQGESVSLQSGSEKDLIDAGKDPKKKDKEPKHEDPAKTPKSEGAPKEKDVGASSKGKLVPRLQKITKRMNMPTVGGRVILSLDHLIDYKPNQVDLFNTRASKAQFNSWYESVRDEYELTDDQMSIVMNGFMVWCVDNGTSPDVNGTWVMMDGDEQVEYPLKPIVENAKPTLRQIMHHFSDVAEAYIEMRNSEGFYMPRYGLLRNLRDKSLARYAFDFYEVNSKTSDRAREAVAQMKAAALANVNTRLFGLDGNVATTSENTERHTARDVNQNMHSLLGMSSGQ
nr:polyprotein [Passiflora chlorosis virus]